MKFLNLQSIQKQRMICLKHRKRLQLFDVKKTTDSRTQIHILVDNDIHIQVMYRTKDGFKMPSFSLHKQQL